MTRRSGGPEFRPKQRHRPVKALRHLIFLACLGSTAHTAIARDTADVLAALSPQQSFEMKDGTQVVVQARVNSVQLRFQDRSRVVLHADGRGGFVSKDGHVSIGFTMNNDDQITEARLSHPVHAGPMRLSLAPAADVVGYWREAGASKWFAKDAAFDRHFRERFIQLHEAARRGELQHWMQSSEGALALVILLDQYPRNAFRGTARMYATDAQALAVAEQAIARGLDRELPADLRLFLYLPFGHSEDLRMQERSVELNRGLTPIHLKQAVHHHDIVQRFGRFPHRNPLLGRPMTPEEQQYLDAGGYAG